jgi:hypothetical protein
MDAGETAMLALQLEQLMAQSFDVKFAPLQARMFLPVRNTTSPGAKVVSYAQYEHVGQALKVTSYADDQPRVNLIKKKFAHDIVSFAAAWELSLQDIRAATFANEPLDAQMVVAARRAVEQAINTMALEGDDDVGIEGLVDNTNITDTNADTGTWSTATADQIWEDFSQGIQLVASATYNQLPCNMVLVPLALKQYLQQRMTDSPVTIEQFVLQNNPGMRIFYSYEMNTADSGSARALFYHKSPETGWIEVPQEYEQLAPQWTNMAYVVNCHARCGGVILPYPFAYQYLDNI